MFLSPTLGTNYLICRWGPISGEGTPCFQGAVGTRSNHVLPWPVSLFSLVLKVPKMGK